MLLKRLCDYILTGFLVPALVLTSSYVAEAQSTRFLSRSVKAGQQIEFQWLNFDERRCKDNGYPRLIIKERPQLGRFRTVRRKFTQTKGKCKGTRFSVLLVYYVAGRKKGRDRTHYVIRGASDINIKLKVRVR